MLRVGIVPSIAALGGLLPDAIIAADPKLAASEANANQILWLALTLTPGLGPTRSRRLDEFFGSIARVFCASLTELEDTSLPDQPAHTLGPAHSGGSRHDVIERPTSAAIH